MKFNIKIAVVVLAVATVSIFATRNDFGLNRNIEIMVNLMREISENYVDQVDHDLLLEYAAQGISRRLDPYTEYLSEDDMSSFELLTTGQYGGIGSLIRQDSDFVRVAQPYHLSPADKAGLIIGDKIVEIDGQSAAGFTTEQVSSRLKGTPSSDVELVVRRLLTGGDEKVTIRRERISIPALPYCGFVADSIGYIQHSDFTQGVGQQMRTQIEAMQREGLRALILDYRNNGGGILQEAVEVVSLFTPRGTEVVKIKGRRDSMSYKTTSAPIALDLPLVVLINENSASASEIVAGALQDLDRAVLVGAKSFGKGLVQSPRPVGYNSYIKLTTSKYYIPSGRCIQELDYSDHSATAKATKVADSLRHEFTTANGRKVYDGGGIIPDRSVEAERISRFAATLYGLGFIDAFGDEYFREHHADVIDIDTFTIDDKQYERFKLFMADKDVPYTSATRGVLKAARDAARDDQYSEIEAQIEALEAALDDDTQSNLERYRKEIIRSINQDIILRHGYQAAVIRNSLHDDKMVGEAIEIINQGDVYRSILTAN